MVAGEPCCGLGTAVCVSGECEEWEGLARFIGHVGFLKKRAKPGWHVFFPTLREEAFFVTEGGVNMLRYARHDADMPLAHIFEYQRRHLAVMRQRTKTSVEPFVAHTFKRQGPHTLSFRNVEGWEKFGGSEGGWARGALPVCALDSWR